MALYWDNPGKPAPELPEALTQYTIFVVYISSQSLTTFPPRPPSLPLGSNTKQNPRETAERNMKNPRTRTDTSFMLT